MLWTLTLYYKTQLLPGNWPYFVIPWFKIWEWSSANFMSPWEFTSQFVNCCSCIQSGPFPGAVLSCWTCGWCWRNWESFWEIKGCERWQERWQGKSKLIKYVFWWTLCNHEDVNKLSWLHRQICKNALMGLFARVFQFESNAVNAPMLERTDLILLSDWDLSAFIVYLKFMWTLSTRKTKIQSRQIIKKTRSKRR